MIVTKTPLRISFFGGGTDYPEFFSRHRGAVFGMAIDKHTYITLRNLHDFFNVKYKVVYAKTEIAASVDDIQHPSVRECLKYSGMSRSAEMHHVADWPARTGLGSSSSFTVGLLHALHTMGGRRPTAKQLALEAIDVERNRIRERVGFQDQIWAAYGGVGVISFGPDNAFSVEQVTIPVEVMERFLTHTLLIYLDVARFAHDILAEQVERTSKRQNDALLLDMLSLVPVAREHFARGEFDDFGRLLDAGWQMKRKLSTAVSNPSIDAVYEKAVGLGAYGGKLLGAGGGGFMLFIVPPERRNRIAEGLAPLKTAEFKPASYGSRVIYAEE